MTFEESLKYIKENKYSAYEISKETGLNEASLRKLFASENAKPQRKTRNIIINFCEIKSNTDGKAMVLDLEEIKKMEDLASDVIKNHKKLLQTEMYSLWFEVESQKRVIEILKG